MLNISPYIKLMRLDKPTGIWLLMFPCWWGALIAYTQNNYSDYVGLAQLLALFFIGSVLMRSAGCIINDIIDRKIDAKVARTRQRPLASGEIKLKSAFLLLIILLLISLVIAVSLGLKIILLSLIWLPLVVLYPFLKRITWFPQAFLGLTFNAGILFGWLAIKGDLYDILPWVLYAGAICWTFGYDTIYAHLDRADDQKIGMKSTALYFADNTKSALCISYGIFIASIAYTAMMLSTNAIGLIIILAISVMLTSQIIRLDINNNQLCMKLFKENSLVGLLLSLAFLVN